MVDRGMDGMVDWGMDGMVDRGMDGMVDWGMDGMVDGSVDGMVDWNMDNSRSMVGLVDSMGNDRSMSMTDNSVGADVRGGGGRGQGKEGDTHESLHDCSMRFCLVNSPC